MNTQATPAIPTNAEAGRFGVFSGWGFWVYPIVRETEQCVFYIDGRERRASRMNCVAILPDRAAAAKLAELLNSAANEASERRKAANIWLAKEQAALIAKATGAA